MLRARCGSAQGRPRGQAAAAAVGAGADGRRRAGACFGAGDRDGGQGGGPQAHAGQRLGQGEPRHAPIELAHLHPRPAIPGEDTPSDPRVRYLFMFVSPMMAVAISSLGSARACIGESRL